MGRYKLGRWVDANATEEELAPLKPSPMDSVLQSGIKNIDSSEFQNIVADVILFLLFCL